MGYYDNNPGVLHAVLDFNSNAAAGNELVAAVASNRVCVLGILAVAAGDVALSLYSDPADTGTEIMGAVPLRERGGLAAPITPDPRAPWCKTEIGESLTGLLGGAVAVTGMLVYYLSPT